MKTKFATFDLCAALHDLRAFVGMRVVNVYDINSKTYLIKLQRPNEKAFILFESGIRIHSTTYDWPKATIPSGFSMKFRKHINTRRLTAVSQVGVDRIVDLQFGDGERMCHVIVELYDRGNVVLTDHNYQILNILRPRTDHDTDVRISVRERYPLELARQSINDFLPSSENILLFLQNAQEGELLRKALVRHVPFGALLLDHAFTITGIPLNAKIGEHLPPSEAGAQLVERALVEASRISEEIKRRPFGGFIAYEEVKRAVTNGDAKAEGRPAIQSYKEYYPYDFIQFRSTDNEQQLKVLEFETFSEAVDKFYSSIETQKAEQRILGAEKEAEKKVQNVRRDHENRIQALSEVQQVQERRAELVLLNKELVEKALYLMRIAIANMSWADIEPWLKTIADQHPVVRSISKLQLNSNRFTMRLSDPEETDGSTFNIDIDIGLNADQNARRFYSERKMASAKEQKTFAASKTALKSAQSQAKNKLNQMKTKKMSTIRARKSYWFEKFHWFISSDRFLVLAGRDAQQNELLVKRYMRSCDIYVHAEIQGAASVVIRNRDRSGAEPPPRTLNEAGTMAVCFSSAWDAGVSVSSWWVRREQVSRTAPTGEYIPAGAFMIRGKRNFLPPCQLQLGFGLMFKLDDESAARHQQRRKEAENEFGSRDGDSSIRDELRGEDEVEKGEEEEMSSRRENGSEQESNEEEEGQNEEEDFPDVQVRVAAASQDASETSGIDSKRQNVGENEEEIDDEEEEEGVGETGEDEEVIDSVVARFEADDQLLCSLPVCAPYTSMQRFKFKVKLTPGMFKRGKAVKQALELFNRDKSLSQAEVTLLKSLTGEIERVTQLLPSKVRVSAPAMNVIKRKK
ncbi:hypothetical protein niasHS_003438 [Heterodera schachtii]|uniref:Nuclear export mediator factor NEMF n=1 Tax=Heterodera schachtii TaxID=97005 RepID=A0ABD2KGI5_HETSC